MKHLLFLITCLLPNLLFAQQYDIHDDLIKDEFFVKEDQSYEQFITRQFTLLTPEGIERGKSYTVSYYPDTQNLELLEAFVIQPNGEKIKVTKENLFERTAKSSAPGFTNQLTTTVVFPQLKIGSKAFSHWKLTQKKKDTLDFNIVSKPNLFEKLGNLETIIHTPPEFKINWETNGEFVVKDEQNSEGRTITATLNNFVPTEYENYMTHDLNITPYFIASSIPSWENIGVTYWEGAKNKARVTPEITQLAKDIVGKKRGIEGSQLLYNWVAQNIHYLQISLKQSAGYEPHDVEDILKNGFGDCKDKVVLLSALLKAIGVESKPVLISAGETYDSSKLPIEMFNHAIIYLPEYNLFADPTDRYSSFGVLSPATSKKLAIIADKEPTITRTPKSQSKSNQYSIKNNLTLDENGNFYGENIIHTSGRYSSIARMLMNTPTSTEKLANDFLANTPEGGEGDLKYSDPNNLSREMEIKSKWKSPLAVEMGNSVFFTIPTGIDLMHPMTLRNYITPGNRHYPIMTQAQKVHWEYEVTLPQNYTVTHLPQNISFKNAAGEYQSLYTRKDNKIHINREFTMNKDVYSPLKYEDLKILLYKPINDARSTIALVEANHPNKQS